MGNSECVYGTHPSCLWSEGDSLTYTELLLCSGQSWRADKIDFKLIFITSHLQDFVALGDLNFYWLCVFVFVSVVSRVCIYMF